MTDNQNKDLSLSEGYGLIQDEREKLAVFHELAGSAMIIHGLATDDAVFQLKALNLQADQLNLELTQQPPGRPLLASESLRLVFSLATGQYYLAAKLALKAANLYAVRISSELYRLQRRSHFRAIVTSSYPVRFVTQSASLDQNAIHMLNVHDISAGGICCLIPDDFGTIGTGQILRGQLRFPDQDALSLAGEIRHIYAPKGPTPQRVGLKWLELSPQSQQFLFVVSLKIQRLTSAHFLR